MTMMTYTPMDRQIDRLFNEALGLMGRPATVSHWTPRCNVYENEQGFVVEAALPGIDSKDLDIQVEDGVVTFSGERKEQPAEGRTYLVKELGVGAFTRSFTLPANVDAGKVSAAYKQGILTITLPKREEAKPRRITIQAD